VRKNIVNIVCVCENEVNKMKSLNESDSEDEGHCLANFAIFDLNNSEADTNTEVPVLQEQTKAGKGSYLRYLSHYVKMITIN